MLDKRVRMFVERGDYLPGSYYAILKVFLQKQEEKGLSRHTISRQFYNLFPIGDGKFSSNAVNPPIQTLTRSWLKLYVNELRLRYATDTVRTTIGDIRQFFKWCKKRGYLAKNLAKPIKPVRRKTSLRHRKAPLEPNILMVMRETAVPLVDSKLIYRNFFGRLQTDCEVWKYRDIMRLRDLFILTFIYETGCRAGELVNLGSRLMDAAVANPAPIYTTTLFGKTREQDYFFTDATTELWHLWQWVRPKAGREFAIVSWRNGRCPTQSTTNAISQMLVRRCGYADLRPFRSHSLRHAKTRRSRKIIGRELTSFLIGHADIETTMGYDYIDDNELIDAVKKTGLQNDIWQQNGRSKGD